MNNLSSYEQLVLDYLKDRYYAENKPKEIHFLYKSYGDLSPLSQQDINNILVKLKKHGYIYFEKDDILNNPTRVVGNIKFTPLAIRYFT